MKRLFIFAAASLLAVPIMATAAVGVSVSVGQPGFYGQINLGDAPPPQVVYSQPMLVEQGPVAVEPIYLHVPPDHARHWRRYCGFYHACGRPVYFVRENWYNNVYVPHYHDHYGHDDHWDHGGDWDHDHHDGDHGDHRGWDHHDGDHGDDHGGWNH